MRDRLRAYRLTPAGGALMLVLGAALIVLAVGPKHDQAAALVLIAVVLTTFIAQAGGAKMSWNRNLQERRAEFGPRVRDEDDRVADADQQELWANERERYRSKNTGD